MRIKCVDLFCGAGGLSYGLALAGIDVVAGFDTDPACKYPYEANNLGKFFANDVTLVPAVKLWTMLRGADLTMVAGCAPCQPFSTYTRKATPSEDWALLYSFSRLVREVEPEVVTMENVPGLVEHQVFKDFCASLKKLGYKVEFDERVNCPDHGIPQERVRLVLIAARDKPVSLLSVDAKKKSTPTVRDTISHLPRLKAGGVCPSDPLHAAAGLTEINLRRIRASKPGGTWRDWPKDLTAKCHRKASGKTYPSVYGRMEWDEPSPTITTQFHGYGNGRFGHPQQDRAISLREGAMLQTFPQSYKFLKEGEKPNFERLGRLVGNAVPVRLGEVIGRAIVRAFAGQQEKEVERVRKVAV